MAVVRREEVDEAENWFEAFKLKLLHIFSPGHGDLGYLDGDFSYFIGDFSDLNGDISYLKLLHIFSPGYCHITDLNCDLNDYLSDITLVISIS